jgi:hypothetical protein
VQICSNKVIISTVNTPINSVPLWVDFLNTGTMLLKINTRCRCKCRCNAWECPSKLILETSLCQSHSSSLCLVLHQLCTTLDLSRAQNKFKFSSRTLCRFQFKIILTACYPGKCLKTLSYLWSFLQLLKTLPWQTPRPWWWIEIYKILCPTRTSISTKWAAAAKECSMLRVTSRTQTTFQNLLKYLSAPREIQEPVL